ncbi:MAG: SdiA-regulated domain-containing protein [Bdellovibrionota bacterium]
MKILIAFLVTLLVSVGYAMSVKNYKSPKLALKKTNESQLEFIELKQFPIKSHKDKFDLSGLVEGPDGSIYVISDKEKNPFIYLVNWKKGIFTEYLSFGIKDKLDIEAIDICEDSFYLSNEKNDKFYIVKKGEETKRIDIDFSELSMKGGLFSGNDGFEGMAVDCENQILYATKEMLPRFIVNIDLKQNKVLKKWTLPSLSDNDFDFTEAKYQNGFLYVLKRSAFSLVKVDLKTEKIVASYSYSNIEKGPGYLFGPSAHAIGEAFTLTKDEIWIGFDNNGLKATEDAQEELGLKGRDPLIVRFKRPENF